MHPPGCSDAKPNPYAKALKRQVTIRLDKPTIEYFKKLSEEVDVPYQSLINLYLRDCAISEKKLELKWASYNSGINGALKVTYPTGCRVFAVRGNQLRHR